MTKNIVELSSPPTFKIGWVHARIIEAYKGLSTDQLTSRRKTGKFIEGVHWRKDPIGSVMWNFENLDSWIEGK